MRHGTNLPPSHEPHRTFRARRCLRTSALETAVDAAAIVATAPPTTTIDPANPLKTDRSGFGGRRAPGVAIEARSRVAPVPLELARQTPTRRDATPCGVEMADAPGHCCSHDHDCDASTCGNASLHGFIDVPAVVAFNALDETAAPGVLRPWEARHDRTGRPLVSEDDGELVVRIPFTTDVKLRGIMVLGGASGRAPNEMRAFANRRDIDAVNASRKTPTQKWDLTVDEDGVLEYTTEAASWQSTSSVTLYFPSNFNGDGETEIWYIGLRGEGTGHDRDMIVTAVYEARPQPQDHEVPGDENAAASRLGM